MLIVAGVAQLVEHFLAKEDVASSSLVTRFRSPPPKFLYSLYLRHLRVKTAAHDCQTIASFRAHLKGVFWFYLVDFCGRPLP